MKPMTAPGATPVSPRVWAGLMPLPPILSSRDSGWRNISACHFRHPFRSGVKAPPLAAHLVVCHLANPSGVSLQLNGRWRAGRSLPGEVMIMAANQPNAWEWDDAPDVLHLYVSTALVQQAAAETGCRRHELIDGVGLSDPVIHRIGLDLLGELRSPGLGGDLYGDALAQALAVQLLRAHSSVLQNPLQDAAALPPYKLRRAIEYVDGHLADDLTIEEIARAASVSMFHFAHAFKRATGLPPHQYVIRRRIERAMHLLRHSELPIAQVALAVGFATQSHFTTVFGRICGATPKKYRDIVKN